MIALALPAFAQHSIIQGGPWGEGRVPIYSGPPQSQPIASDSGPAGGSGPGVGEMAIIARGPAQSGPPFAGLGTGPYGTNFCDYDGPTTSAAGYHYICLSANAQGGGIIAYGAQGAATPQNFQFIINGTPFTFPFNFGLTGYLYGHGLFSPVTASTTIPASVIVGTLPPAVLPTPTVSTLGGALSSTAPVNQFATGLNTSGALTYAQPSFANISGTLGATQLPALTGDVTTPGGSLATTLATVNANTGSWGSSTAIPNFTVNGKGLLTAAGTNAVIAPAGTLTGSSIASGVANAAAAAFSTGSSLYPVVTYSSVYQYDQNSSHISNTIGAKNAWIGQAAKFSTNFVPTWQTWVQFAGVTSAAMIVSTNGQNSLVIGSRLSDNPQSGGLGAPENFVNQVTIDAATSSSTWNTYNELDITSAASYSSGAQSVIEESDIWQQTTTVVLDPYTNTAQGGTAVHRDSAGAGRLSGNSVSAWAEVLNNFNTFKSGLIFGSSAIDTTGGFGNAIQFPAQVGEQWYSAAATSIAQIDADVISTVPTLIFNSAGQYSIRVAGSGILGVSSTDFFPINSKVVALGATANGFTGLFLSGATSGYSEIVAPAVAGTGVFTLPASATDTLVARNSTDTLTNKSLTSPTLTGTVTEPDSATWTSSGISSIVAIGVGVAIQASIASSFQGAGATSATYALVAQTSGGIGHIILGARDDGYVIMPSLTNAAGNDILCFNTTGGLVTYEPSVATCIPSARRLKNEMDYFVPATALTRVMTLRPGAWTYKDSRFAGRIYAGVYADEVCAMDSRLCFYDANGDVENYDKVGLTGYVVAAVQGEQDEISHLQTEFAAYKAAHP